MLLAFCAAIYFLDGLIHSILGPLAPDIARDLAFDSAALGRMFSANLAGQCIGLVMAPWLARRAGQRLVVIASVVGFGIGQCGSAWADGFASLFLWRLLTGAFLGGCLPGCLAMVSAAAPASRRGLAIMVLFMGYGSGATVAGLLAAAVGAWRVSMVIVGACSLFTALLAFVFLRVPRTPHDGEPSAPDASRSGFVAILSGPYRLRTLMLWLLFIVMLTISYCLNSWLPTVLVEVGRAEQFGALAVSMFSFGGILAALVVGLLIDRFGAVPTLVGFTSAAAVLLVAVGNSLASAPASVLMALLGSTGFFALGAYGGVNVILADAYPASLRATGIGWAKSIGRIGTVLAPMAIGVALSAGMGGQAVLAWFALPALVAIPALLLAARDSPSASR